MITVHQIINSPVPSNCFVIFDKTIGKDCVIVDPGSKSSNELSDFLDQENLKPKYIILTHEHFDHCWGVNELVEKFHVPVVCSMLCAECIRYEKRNCSVFYDINERFTIECNTLSVEALDFELVVAGIRFEFMSTPGHTNASVCFTVDRCLFTGDTLIKGLRTVTKLPTGSLVKLKDTLELISKLKGKGYIIYPGHGETFAMDNYVLETAL